MMLDLMGGGRRLDLSGAPFYVVLLAVALAFHFLGLPETPNRSLVPATTASNNSSNKVTLPPTVPSTFRPMTTPATRPSNGSAATPLPGQSSRPTGTPIPAPTRVTSIPVRSGAGPFAPKATPPSTISPAATPTAPAPTTSPTGTSTTPVTTPK